MPEDTMLNEAIESLRKGDKVRAKDLLTRLLKADQKNVDYWIWLSAAVETQKEKIYCLQTALKLDPSNFKAKRGLIILGAIKNDEVITPFPIEYFKNLYGKNEQKNKEKIKGFRSLWKNPYFRVGSILGMAILLLLGIWIGLNPPKASTTRSTRTPGPSPTYTITPTALNAGTQILVTQGFLGATPLWMLLSETYTPTPLYVITQHPVTSSDAYNAGIRYFEQGNWMDAIQLFQQVISLEPGAAADAWFYIGEAYHQMGDYPESKQAFDNSIAIDPNFAAAYLGRATMLKLIDPKTIIINDLDNAISLDPNYPLAYIARADYFLEVGDLDPARIDIQSALALNANSSEAYCLLARLELAGHNYIEALEAAKVSNEIDITNLQSYLVLGQAYMVNDQAENAVNALEIYLAFNPDNTDAMIALATARNFAEYYQDAIKLLDSVIKIQKRNGEAYYQRGMAYLGLEEYKKAVENFKYAIGYDPNDFDASVSLAQAYIAMNNPGEAYLEIKKRADNLAGTDQQFAQVYYWEALALEGLENTTAITFWQELLKLPEDSMPAEWRLTAMDRLETQVTGTPLPTITPTATPTLLRTPAPSKTP